MSSTDVINAQPQTVRVRVPAGAAHALCQLGPTRNGTISATKEVLGRRIEIETPDDGLVLFPTDVGLTLLSALNAEPGLPLSGARVLDIGCGSGLYTVALASAGAAHVTALDINPACAEVTRDNASRNGISPAQVATIVGDLAELAVPEPWDLVVCNPPHFPHDPVYAVDDGIETALVGGSDGRALYDVLLARSHPGPAATPANPHPARLVGQPTALNQRNTHAQDIDRRCRAVRPATRPRATRRGLRGDDHVGSDPG